MLRKLKKNLYDRDRIDWKNLMFSSKALKTLLIPLIIEQLLNCFMGMADTIMVSQVGSEAISAVSLVDSINVLVIQVFAALATGGTIICSQYIGRMDEKDSNNAAQQVTLTVTVISLVLMILCLIFRSSLLRLIFGKVDAQVMSASLTYFWITVLSFPFIALFNAGSAFFRAGGESRFPMRVSVISNIMNIIGNAILIFGFHMGVAGAAFSTLISRIFCAVVVFYYLRKPRQPIVIRNYLQIRPDYRLIRKILAIGIPSGVENGMFQFGKLAIQSSVSTLGTAAIAAQAMTLILENMNGIAGIGIGIGLMTVVGQCMGGRRIEEAKYYIVKLSAVAELAILASCILTYLLCRPILLLAGMEPESTRMCLEMMTVITIVKPIVWTFSFVPAYGMRAAGDVKFSMISSTLSMWICRVALCIFLIHVMGFGPMAVWIGMFTDWAVRGVIYVIRFFSGKWTQMKVI